MLRTTRIHVQFPPELDRKLMALALANTMGNRSQLIAQLVNRAAMFPSEFSLISPHDAGITDQDIDDALARYRK